MRILVVEDEVKTADYLSKGLSESGYLVEVALNGLDGQHMVQESEFDLIILDVMLPGLDGWQLLQQLQAEKTDRVDIVLRQQQAALYPVMKVEARADSSGKLSYAARYPNLPALPCDSEGVDCKVAAKAFIDYLQAKPELWQQQREPTVTLQR